MDRRSTRAAVVVAVISLTVLVLPGCKRAPEEAAPPAPVAPAAVEHPPVAALELPQTNSEIGITLGSVPQVLAVTLNTSLWIELVDLRNPAIRYSFVGVPPDLNGPTPATAAAFETRVHASPNGRIADRGSVDTVFGTSEWICGVYDDDDGAVEDIHLFVPHPSGSGMVVLTSVCPPDAAGIDQRLSVMQELLEHVS